VSGIAPVAFAGCQSGPGHAFAEASFFEKVLLESANLLVQQVTRQFDEASDDVRANSRIGVFDAFQSFTLH
jgi:hypothetical protein